MAQKPPSSLTKTQAAFHRIREAIEDGSLRAAANRLRSAVRSALPAIAGPAPPNEPTYEDDNLGEAIQKSMTRPRLSVHDTSFLWALCRELVRSTTHRFVA